VNEILIPSLGAMESGENFSDRVDIKKIIRDKTGVKTHIQVENKPGFC
jgi:hypothetical protein